MSKRKELITIVVSIVVIAISVHALINSSASSPETNREKEELLSLIEVAKENIREAEQDLAFVGTPEEVEQMMVDGGYTLAYARNTARYAWAVYYSIELTLAKWKLRNLEWELRLLS